MTTLAEFEAVLDHGGVDKGVAKEVIVGQLATAVDLRERLDEHGGVILGDEVGAGKTFTTFAVLVETLLRSPDKGAVVFAPKRLLRDKWCSQLVDYLRSAVTDQAAASELVDRIVPVGRPLCNDGTLDPDRWGEPPAENSIVVTTHDVYSYRTRVDDQAACLRAALATFPEGEGRRPSGLLRASGITAETRAEWVTWAQSEILDAHTLAPLRDIVSRYAAGERGLGEQARRAILEVRRLVGRKRLPHAALVVIDEAHNLNSTHSSIYQALMAVLSTRFDGLLFLTATPFQLGRDELLNVVAFFKEARAYEGREDEFVKRVDRMRTAMDGWMDALDVFGALWRDLNHAQTDECRHLAGGTLLPAATSQARRAADAFADCLRAKDALEAGMRPFLVRSLRPRNHNEHRALADGAVSEDARIPLALVDRLIVELLSVRRTFVSSALVSACSSWPALRAAAVMQDDEDQPGLPTRPVLARMHDGGLLGNHPKVQQTIDVCTRGLGDGEKTLVFVEREQTGRQLRDSVLAAIEATDDESPSNAALLARLQDRARFGWPSLRENYLHTIYPLIFGEEPDPDDVDTAWQDTDVRALWSRVDVEGERRNYVIEKRFWEHVLFVRAAKRHPRWESEKTVLAECVGNILRPEYVLNGLDLKSGKTGTCQEVPSAPRRSDDREPRLPFAKAFVAYQSPWAASRESLRVLTPHERADFVDGAADAMARSHFRQELAAVDVGDPAEHFKAIETLLSNPATQWPERFRALAAQAHDAVNTHNEDQAQQRIANLIDALGSDVRVQFISGNTPTKTQQNAIDGFNTPLYPEVIVTTSVLAEGLDLHRFCRRVVHHDLPWNPAKLEQRTGRVDRVGSLSERTGEPIDVWLPYVPGTYDEFIYERVMARRREFRCLLGNKPEWRDEVLSDDETGAPMEAGLVDRLQVDLGPQPVVTGVR